MTVGQRSEGGSGFLFRFRRNDEQREVFGFLTCYHVIRFDPQQPLPGTAQVMIRFQSDPPLDVSLDQIQDVNAEVHLSAQNDIYFIEVSPQYRTIFAGNRIPFYESMDPVQDQQLWIAQYPGSTERHVANALLTRQLLPNAPFFPHQVSTSQGSSGSPLLQFVQGQIQNGLVAIGMHHGELQPNPPLNYASSIATIKDFLNYRLLHGADPPFNVHPTAAVSESYPCITLYCCFNLTYIRQSLHQSVG